MSRGLHEITWGEFLDRVQERGVQFIDGQSGQYLFRVVDGEDKWAAMPEFWSREELVGFFVVLRTCRRLDIPVLGWFGDYYINY